MMMQRLRVGARPADLRRPRVRSNCRAIPGGFAGTDPGSRKGSTGSSSRDPLPLASSPPTTHGTLETSSRNADAEHRPAPLSASRRRSRGHAGDTHGAVRRGLAHRQSRLRARSAGTAPAPACGGRGGVPPGRLRAAAVRSPAAAVRGGRSRRRGGGARDPARRSASRARPGDRVRPLSARRAPCARARRPGRAPRARGAPRPGTTALAVGGLGRPAVPDVDHSLRRGRGWQTSSTRLRPTPPSRPACPSTGWSRREPSSPPAWARSACTARVSTAIPRSSWPSCSARSCSAPDGGGSDRRGASTPRRRSRLPSERPIGWWLEAESVHARLRRGEQPRELLSARRCAARRARSGTRA